MAGVFLQGGSSSLLQGGYGGVNLQNAGSGSTNSAGALIQPSIGGAPLNTTSYAAPAAAAPRTAYTPPSVGGFAQGDGGAAAAAASAAAQAAAQAAAERAARVESLRGNIGGIIDNIKNTYDSIYGTAQTTANEQNQDLTTQFGKTANNINSQANTGSDQVSAAYNATGAGDSSYHSNAVGQVKNAAVQQLDQAGQELKTNQANIGQFLTQQETQRSAQKSGLDSILQQISQSNDPNELSSLQNTLTSRLANLQASAADVQGNKAYLANLAKVTPEGDRINALQGTLAQIIAGSAASSLKKSVGLSFIQASGLSDQAKKSLIDQLNGTIDGQDKRNTPQTPAAPAAAN